jgi:peptidoglycan/LPS O-acetylase OafA/YrhL
MRHTQVGFDRWRHASGLVLALATLASGVLLDVRWAAAIGGLTVGWFTIGRRERLTALDLLAIGAAVGCILFVSFRPGGLDTAPGGWVTFALLAVLALLVSAAAFHLITSGVTIRRELRRIDHDLKAVAPK